MGKEITCAWILKSGKACGRVVPYGCAYCRVHNPMASIFADTQGARSAQQSGVSETKQQAEFDEDEERKDLERAIRRFKRDGKTLKVTRKDFPCIIDGLHYETIQEYYELNQPQNSHEYEMPGTDQYAFWNHHTQLPKWQPSEKTKPVPLPVITLEPDTCRKLETIRHMNYLVARRGDKYYAVWISLSQPDKLEDAMKQAKEHPWPMLQPVQVLASRCYTSEAFHTFRKAEDCFYRGSESFGKIKGRISKAEDPNYIPPNLRTLAVEATYHAEVWSIIPQNEHERLKEWLYKGCIGWFGKNPNPIWYAKQGWKYTPRWTSSKDNNKGGYQAT